MRKTAGPRSYDTRRASDLPASIPRLDREQYRKTLTEYRSGAKSAAELTHQRVRVGEKTVDIAEINRFASPRSALERQGIPVVSAGSDSEVEPASSPVPISTQDGTGTN